MNREIGIGKGWSYQGIYHFNVLFQFVRNDRIKNKGFITKWLVEKRQLMASTSRRTKKHVSPEVFAQKTLSEKEYKGANDETNRQKMTAMKTQFKIVEEKKQNFST